MQLIVGILLSFILTLPDVWAANICDPTISTRCQEVDANGNAFTAIGPSSRASFIASTGALTAATAHALHIESAAGVGFRLTQWCVGLSNATAGTLGATVDQSQVQVGIIATGAGAVTPFCKTYGERGEQPPAVPAGVSNGLTISVPTLGAGSLATSISATIIQD